MVIECNVWCSDSDEDDQLSKLGIDSSDDCWMPVAIDFSKIEHIKLAGKNDFIGDNKACIGMKSGIMIIDIPYEKAVRIWKECLMTSAIGQ